MSQIKPISDCFIRPEIEIEDSKRCYELNALQLSMLPANYIHMGYLFRKPFNFSPSLHFNKLKFTLSKALVPFYPLAGRLVTEPSENEHSCCIYVDCSKGPGAKLIYAHAPDVTLDHIASIKSDVSLIVRYLFDLGEKAVNHDGHTRPLLSVQLTELADGVFLGFSVNHCLVDGTSYTHFYQTWSGLFMGSSNRCPIIENPSFLNGKEIVKLPYLNPSEFIVQLSDTESRLRERFFHFSVTSIKNLKTMANNNSADVTISSFQALSAFIWRCITRARHVNPDQTTSCALPVNLRPRLNPPLSDDYFGSYFRRVKATANVGHLLQNNLNWAAMLLHKALLSMDEKAAREVFERAYNLGPQMFGSSHGLKSNDVFVGGSHRFDNYGPEFGMGVAVGCRAGYGNKYDGKVNCFSGSEGEGSVDVELVLADDTMTELLLDHEFMSIAMNENLRLDLVSRI